MSWAIILKVLALVLFFLGAIPWKPVEAYKVSLISAGLGAWLGSNVVPQ